MTVRIRGPEDPWAGVVQPGRPERSAAGDEVPDRPGALIVPDRNPRPVPVESVDAVQPDSFALRRDMEEWPCRLSSPDVPDPQIAPAENHEARAVIAKQDDLDRLGMAHWAGRRPRGCGAQ